VLDRQRASATIPSTAAVRDSFVGDFVLNEAGTEIHALDQFNTACTIDPAPAVWVRARRRNPFPGACPTNGVGPTSAFRIPPARVTGELMPA
jgi:hypothetical protein